MRSPKHLAGRSVAALAVLGLAACTTIGRTPEPDSTRTTASAPLWDDQPLSWAKLAEIEHWLAGPGPREWPDAVPRAQLELAEGRLSFARRAPDAATRRSRLDAAQHGFEAVLEHPESGSFERSRARDGLQAVQRLAGTAPTPPTVARPDASFRVLPRSAWGAASANPARMTAHHGPWTRITVHHSAKTRAEEIGGGSAAEVTAALARVQRFHMEERRWGDIGYHFLIDPSGRIYAGRSLEWRGAHAQGSNNVANIGVCLLGNFMHEQPSAAGLEALDELLDRLTQAHSIPRSRVYAHRELVATECPGDRMMTWVEGYRRGAPPLRARHTAQARTRTSAPAAVQ